MLYNITFKTYDQSTRLIPHVPYTAAPDEDRIMKRVCFADSIEHCISAIGPSNRDLYTGCYIVVRSVDESCLKPSKLIVPEELFHTGKVPDALENQEYWYLDEIDVKRELYKVNDFMAERALAFSCIKKDDLGDLMEKYSVPMKQNETVEQAYDRTINILYKACSYNEADAFEEDVAALPWAQTLKVTGLVMKKIK